MSLRRIRSKTTVDLNKITKKKKVRMKMRSRTSETLQKVKPKEIPHVLSITTSNIVIAGLKKTITPILEETVKETI